MTVAEFVGKAMCPVYDGLTEKEITLQEAETTRKDEEVLNFTVSNGYLIVTTGFIFQI